MTNHAWLLLGLYLFLLLLAARPLGNYIAAVMEGGTTLASRLGGGLEYLLYRLSSGTPRLVNVLAHKAMLLAFGEGKNRVSRAHVSLAGRDTEGLPAQRWWHRW